MEENKITGSVIAAAVQVHRVLGPGLLESAYRTCLIQELRLNGVHLESEVPLQVAYRGIRVGCGYRLDLLVEQRVIVELKAVHALEELHTAQLVTYLRLSGKRIGLLINFNVPLLKQGIRRVVLGPQ